MKLPSGTIKRIHVDQHAIRRNIKGAEVFPPLTVQTSRGSLKGFRVAVLGPSELVYRPHNPLSCGARLWIETRAEVDITDYYDGAACTDKSL